MSTASTSLDRARPPTATATAAPPAAVRSPIRIPMGPVLLACLALVVVELVAALLTMTPLHTALLGACLTVVVVFGAVFAFGAITIAGFAAGAGAAGVVVLEPRHLVLTLVAMAVIAVVCGLAPGWARVEAWQAARSAGAPLTGDGVRTSRLPGRLAVLWRTDRVVAAFLVLSFPPVFVTGAVAFITWTATRG
ncbi:hypothetical protein [Modestobacter sp. Leaf380]|uniref:hypothetical protein n=1 Tax=Modestobacter sp. Leaf380 TaxID=1736356 RepID=UPI0007006ABD|nr:hypothetical protein [Modestobacter sp. Leaf380]KQS66080.1 hypothetical protein ASG41_11960 [Modestobacter sp. Leaf380]